MKNKTKFFTLDKKLLTEGDIYPFDLYCGENRNSDMIFLGLGEPLSSAALKYLLDEKFDEVIKVKIKDQDSVFKFFKIDKDTFWSSYGKEHELNNRQSLEKKENPVNEKFQAKDELLKGIKTKNYYKLREQCRAEISEYRFDINQWTSTIKGLVEELLRREDPMSQKVAIAYYIGQKLYHLSREHLLNVLALSFFNELKDFFNQGSEFQESITLIMEELDIEYDPRFLMSINGILFEKKVDYLEICTISEFLHKQQELSLESLEDSDLSDSIKAKLFYLIS